MKTDPPLTNSTTFFVTLDMISYEDRYLIGEAFNYSVATVLLEQPWLKQVRQLIGVASLLGDPPLDNSTTRQNQPICNPTLDITVTFKPKI